MTDRIAYLTVLLDKDYRDDDVQSIVQAIEMTKGVGKVELGKPVDVNDHIAREQSVTELWGKVSAVFRDFQFPK